MRSIWTLLALLLPLAVLAQQPPPAPNEQQMLNQVLGKWEQAMTGLKSFDATCRRTSLDKTFGGKDVYEGTAKFEKGTKDQPGIKGQPSRALLKMEKKGDPAKYEKFLLTGPYLYEFIPATKVLRVYDVPHKAGQPVMDDNFLALLFGQMGAAQALQRYDIRWIPDKKDNNKWYHYLQILPRNKQDMADFTEARLVLTAKDFLPRQLWYHEPNGNEKTFDFDKLDVNVNIPATVFLPPQKLDPGWRLERIQPQGAVQASGTVKK